ncbi:ABC transporter permease [Allopusillimonas ginsengisoli]|uniref:ABC transporter permease n=1 Tax=Allopusillimonas ginsengisoli TaxID=453575 RepID=UPI001020F998|nr:ABC transporter permease [Allopusillimonas ginsengisoli]TEA74178.1 ABC transporter permease [Allopusillimonas ginsengisoli]
MGIFLLPIGLFLLGLFILPLGYVVYASFADPQLGIGNYIEIFTRPLYIKVLANTLEISLLATCLTLIIGYVIAYHLARCAPRTRAILLTLVLLPFWTSILVKSYAFTIILGHDGIINTLIRGVLNNDSSLKLLFNRPGVIIGMTHYLLPFMIFILLNNLQAQDPALRQAARIMAASSWRIFWRITVPLSLPSVMAGSLICVILSLGMFITPELLGGKDDLMISSLVDFNVRQTLNWGVASALAVVLVLLAGLLTLLLSRVRDGQLIADVD